MAIKLGVETNCMLTGVVNNTDAQSLVDMGISIGSYTMELVRECELRPRVFGGPTAEACKDCSMKVTKRVAQSVREMAERVALRLATE